MLVAGLTLAVTAAPGALAEPGFVDAPAGVDRQDDLLAWAVGFAREWVLCRLGCAPDRGFEHAP